MARIPASDLGRACICAQCFSDGMSKSATGVTKVTDPGNRAAYRLEDHEQSVTISKTGAQILSFTTAHGDVLWTASAPEYHPGKPVRGGIPVVFPWFGDHKTDPAMPAHGFARSLEWNCTAMDTASVTLTCSDSKSTRSLWNFAFRCDLQITLDEDLQVTMTVTNTGDQEISFEQALHTYFASGDIHEASVHGLQNVPFTEHAREPVDAWDPSQPICFRAETDRVFQHVPDEISLHAKTLGRTVKLRTDNSRSTVVWNPWPNKTARLSQMLADDWRSFVCIESANVGEHCIQLAPNASHTMTLAISVSH